MIRPLQKTDHAVSPVVGVMLMLVVTIIIAAIVSAFAGGISAGSEKAPNAQINVRYSQANGITMENTGPDTIDTQGVTVWTRLGESFGQAEHGTWQVNKSTILNVPEISRIGATATVNNRTVGAWYREAGLSGVKTWSPGETMYILPPYHTAALLQPGASASSYGYSTPVNLGKSFYLELKTTDGKVFSKNKVLIEA